MRPGDPKVSPDVQPKQKTRAAPDQEGIKQNIIANKRVQFKLDKQAEAQAEPTAYQRTTASQAHNPRNVNTLALPDPIAPYQPRLPLSLDWHAEHPQTITLEINNCPVTHRLIWVDPQFYITHNAKFPLVEGTDIPVLGPEYNGQIPQHFFDPLPEEVMSEPEKSNKRKVTAPPEEDEVSNLPVAKKSKLEPRNHGKGMPWTPANPPSGEVNYPLSQETWSPAPSRIGKGVFAYLQQNPNHGKNAPKPPTPKPIGRFGEIRYANMHEYWGTSPYFGPWTRSATEDDDEGNDATIGAHAHFRERISRGQRSEKMREREREIEVGVDDADAGREKSDFDLLMEEVEVGGDENAEGDQSDFDMLMEDAN